MWMGRAKRRKGEKEDSEGKGRMVEGDGRGESWKAKEGKKG